MNQNNYLPPIIAGSILLLAFITLSNPLNVNKKGNLYFGLFLIVWSSFWLDDLLALTPLENNFYFGIIKSFFQFLVPLLFYCSVLFYTSPFYKFQLKDLRFSVVPVIFLVILCNKAYINELVLDIVFTILLFGHSLFYIVLAYITVLKHQKNIESFTSNKEPIDLNWIKYIIYILIGSTLISLLNNSFLNKESFKLYFNLFFLCAVYFVAFFSIRQVEVHPHNSSIDEMTTPDQAAQENSTPKNKQILSDSELERQKQVLMTLMEAEKPYLDSELDLLTLANKLYLSTHQLSYIINSGFGDNFFNFVNGFRVQKAKELLKDQAHDKYTILAIGFDSGFNSKTAFNTTFKKITSYTPTEYRKLRSTL